MTNFQKSASWIGAAFTQDTFLRSLTDGESTVNEK